MNLDEFNALVSSVYMDSDRALLVQGLALGLNGGTLQTGVPDAFARAYELGLSSRQEAEEFRRQMSQNGSRGGRPAHRQDPGEHEPDYGLEEPAGKPEGNQLVNQLVDQQGNQTPTQSTIHNPLTTTQETERAQAPSEDRKKPFKAPTREEWSEHCRTTWPMWDLAAIHGSFEYYAGNEWRKANGAKLSSWKGAAATSFSGWLARNPNFKRLYADHLEKAKSPQNPQLTTATTAPARMSPLALIQERAKNVA